MTDPARVVEVPRLHPRDPAGHKGTYGRVLVVAGRRGMTGAAVLAGGGALRGGAGLVTVACPADVQDVVSAGNPCYLTTALPGPVGEWADAADVVAAGPGLGKDEAIAEMVAELLRKRDRPLVLDADALNVLDGLDLALLARRPAATVLTPHPGEFARLIGKTTKEVQADREPLAVGFARVHNVVLLLKGHQTIVTDGTRVYVNDTGNPGMATGGCGDVLTGLLAALLAQLRDGFAAAVLGAWAHGRAGDLAAESLGHAGLTAADVLAAVPGALKEVGG